MKKTLIDYQQAVAKSKKTLIDYKRLRKINPEAARAAVLEYLNSNGGNISDSARVFGLQRVVIYDIINKSKLGDLKDRSKAPRKVANKTPKEVEEKVVSLKKRLNLGPKAISFELYRLYGLDIPYSTIRSILRRMEQTI